MKFIVGIMCLAALLHSPKAADAARSGNRIPELPLPAVCLQTFQISRGENPWSGLTEGYEEEQAAKRVKSVALNAGTYEPLPSLTAFDRPDMLMGRSEKRKEVVVNKRYFSELKRGDATRLGMGQEQVIGSFRDHAFKRLKADELVRYLLRSQIIETYWHLEAKLCMFREENQPSSYRAFYRGVHTYCTNSCNDQAYSFVVTIDKRSGAMVLSGGDILDVRP
jgi:hypothetical protein